MIYADELGEDVELTFTREAPEGWSGHTGRLDSALLANPAVGTTAFVCGSNGFVESATQLLVEQGVEDGHIRTERFGATS